MNTYIYLVLTPESIIASSIGPAEFGNYLAVGTKKRTRGQIIFFEVDATKVPTLPTNYISSRLVPYPDGEPKRSVYCCIYRAIEMIPMDALKSLYLTTDDGRVLELKPSTFHENEAGNIHLYQQFNPVTTRVASKLSPSEFVKFLTDTTKPVSAPKIVFAELLLNELATNPNAPLSNLPYPNPDHLRDCLIKLHNQGGKMTKTVIRYTHGDLSYRTIKNGFFIGDQKKMLYYPLPSVAELESAHYQWWRSALIQHF